MRALVATVTAMVRPGGRVGLITTPGQPAVEWSPREWARVCWWRWLVATGRLPVGMAEETSAGRRLLVDFGEVGFIKLLLLRYHARRGYGRG